MPNGRIDTSIGAVSIGGLKGDNKCNALMKAETKAKRRLTLSICGLGMLDETEIETVRIEPKWHEKTTKAIAEEIQGSPVPPASAGVTTGEGCAAETRSEER